MKVYKLELSKEYIENNKCYLSNISSKIEPLSFIESSSRPYSFKEQLYLQNINASEYKEWLFEVLEQWIDDCNFWIDDFNFYKNYATIDNHTNEVLIIINHKINNDKYLVGCYFSIFIQNHLPLYEEANKMLTKINLLK